MKAGWEIKALGEVCDFQGGGQPPKSEFVFEPREGYIRMLQIRDFKSDDKAVYIPITNRTNACLEEDIMIGRYGASVGQIHRGKSGAYNVALIKTIPDPNLLNRDYFYYYLTSDLFQLPLVTVADRSAQAGFSKQDISPFPIPLPPLDEQKRIVEVLDAAFEGLSRARAHTETNLQNARELFESGLESIVASAATRRPNVALSTLTTTISDGDHAAPPKAADGVPFITISNVDKETLEIDFSDTFKVPQDYYDSLKDNRKPKLGDVLYSVTGSFGIPVHVKENTAFCFQRHIGLVRPKPALDSRWLFFLLLSPHVYRQADEGASGTAQRTVSLTQLRSFSVPDVPPAEQIKFAAALDAQLSKSRELQSHYRAKLADLDALRQALLQKAFAGELC